MMFIFLYLDRLRVLKHHPDKRQAAGEKVNPEGDYFACIVKAYEILSNVPKRQAYDSVDPLFDNYNPPKSVKSPDEFFSVKLLLTLESSSYYTNVLVNGFVICNFFSCMENGSL